MVNSKSIFFSFFISFLFLIGKLSASHAVGADIYYECIGNNQYRIYLNFYRDCAGVSAPTSASVSISSVSCGRNLSLNLARQSFSEVPALCPNQQNQSRCRGGSLPGIQQHIYSGVVTLPAQCNDWRISYDLCCRNSSVTNLVGPGNQDLYIEALLNNTNGLCNNSPIFTTLPVPYLCAGQQYFYNHGAVDIDGDSLVYKFINPQRNPNSNIPYISGFNINNPMRTIGQFQFSTTTGQMTFTPSQVQNAVVTVLVEEYRNGLRIGSTMRDIQVVVLNCNNSPPISSPITNISGATLVGANAFEANVCSGTPLCFDITSSDTDPNQLLNMTWNNSIPGASFVVAGQPPVGRFCWTPTTADIGLNSFVVEVADNACPIPGRSTRSYSINVFNASLNITTTSTPVTCSGNANGTATVNVTGAIPPITYLWSNGQNIATITGLTSGSYSLTVQDAGSCPIVSSVVVAEPPMLNTSIITTPAVCNGEQNGSASVTVSGGNGAPYSFLWSNGETTPLIDSLPSGIYFLTITDAAGCNYDTNAFIFQPGPLVINATATTTSNYNGRDISCYGANDGEVTLIISGGTMPYIYNWSVNANGQNDSIINNLGPGLYSVTLSDQNGCNTGAFITLTEPPPLVLNAAIINNASCFGSNDGSATATVTGGTLPYNYNWSVSANNQSLSTATNLQAGTHYITVTDVNNCAATDTVTTTQPDILEVSLTSIGNYNGYDITCNGASDGVVLANATGGTIPYTYQWDAAAMNQTGDIAYDLPIGTYSVMVTDSNGCIAQGNIVLSQPLLLQTLSAITSNYNDEDVSCYNAFDGSASTTPFGGVPPYNYFWSNANMAGNNAIDLGADSTYTVRITDANECVIFDSVILSQPTEIIVDIIITSDYNGTPISCTTFSDGSLAANATGGVVPYSYLWNNNDITNAPDGLNAGNYIITVTDANGCSTSSEINLIEPESLNISTTIVSNYNGEDISCFNAADGVANAAATGGIAPYLYQWDAAANQTGSIAENLSEGSYTVTVTDLNGCTTTSNITLLQPLPLAVSITPINILCFEVNNGSATTSVSGGVAPYNYLWNNNAVTDNINNLSAGEYAVTISDANNCTIASSTTISQPPILTTDTLTRAATCYESADGFATIITSGGTPQYTYEWSEGNFSDSTYNGFERGIYYVTITDANGCSNTETIFINAPEPISVNAFVVSENSNTFYGDTVGLQANNTTTNITEQSNNVFYWTPSNSLSCDQCYNPLAFPLSTTLYEVTMVDVNGCTATDTITVTINPQDKILYIPNAFSPNGDGINDIFLAYSAGVKEIDFSVFNRWGEKIFFSNDISFGWDGYYKGSLMPPSVFVYYIQVTYLDGDVRTAKGSVTLVR